MTWYCEHCGMEIDQKSVTSDNLHDKNHNGCGHEVYEIDDTNFAAWGETGYPPETLI